MKKVVFVLGSLMASSAWAACDRADVDYYLEKGFTPDQITTLCSAAVPEAPAPSKEAAPKAEVVAPVQAPVQPTVIKPELAEVGAAAGLDQKSILTFLAKSLKVKDLQIEGDQLTFSQKFKAKYGEEDVFGNLEEVKPYMQVTIELPSLRVIKTAARIPVLRGAYVLVSGDVQQSVVKPEQYKAKELEGIKTYLAEEVGQNTVKIKVHSDADINEVGSQLQELGLMYRKR